MTRLQVWLQAARPASQTYIAFPILFGGLLFVGVMDAALSVAGLILAQAFGLFDQLYIVFANDYADRDLDGHNTTYNMFSGGSRVLVEGQLSSKALGTASVLMVALSLVTGIGLWLLHGRVAALAAIVLGLLLLWAYSFPPFKLSYRGGGELLQMAGVGGVLPLVGWLAQGGALTSFPGVVLAVTLPVSLACAITTSLPDEPSDRAGGKSTASVLLGTRAAQAVALVLFAGSLAAILLLQPLSPNRLSVLQGAAAGPGVGLLGHAATVLVPLLLCMMAIRDIGAKPGTAALNRFVALLVAANIALFLGLCVIAFLS